MRWLQTQNRIEEMADVLSKIAKSNGKTLPSSLGPVKDALIVNAQINKMVIILHKYILYV
jgi:OCT family organic cation transporter-like MFS transporter 4/5